MIEQAVHWKRHAHNVYVCIPKPKRLLNDYARELLRREGIGILLFEELPIYAKIAVGYDFGVFHDKDRYPVRINRRISGQLKRAITDYHGDGNLPGGSRGGGYITDYRITMMHVKEFLEWVRMRQPEDGWRTVHTILNQVTTHYSTPKQSLAKALHGF